MCSAANADQALSLGADRVIDYRTEAVTGRYDLVLDLVGNRSLGELRSLLAPDGTLVLSGGGVFEGGSLFGPMRLFLKAAVISRVSRDRVVALDAAPNRETLASLRELVESGAVRPVLERTYPLAEVPEAIRRLEVEHARPRSRSPSERSQTHAVSLEHGGGVDGVTATGVNLDVHVRAGRVAGHADGADHLAGGDVLPRGDRQGLLVAVPDLGAASRW